LNQRNQIHNAVDDDTYFRKSSPHISLINRFKVQDEHLDDVVRLMEGFDIEGEPIKVNGLSSGGHFQSPTAVFADVELDIEKEITALIKELEEYSKTAVKQIDDYHLTYMRTTGWWDKLPPENQKRLRNELELTLPITDIEVKKVNVEVNSSS
jgi:2'-5' RNA ligase